RERSRRADNRVAGREFAIAPVGHRPVAGKDAAGRGVRKQAVPKKGWVLNLGLHSKEPQQFIIVGGRTYGYEVQYFNQDSAPRHQTVARPTSLTEVLGDPGFEVELPRERHVPFSQQLPNRRHTIVPFNDLNCTTYNFWAFVILTTTGFWRIIV